MKKNQLTLIRSRDFQESQIAIEPPMASFPSSSFLWRLSFSQLEPSHPTLGDEGGQWVEDRRFKVLNQEGLSLILNPKEVDAQFSLLTMNHKPRSFQLEGNTTFIFALHGEVSIEVFSGSKTVTLKKHETLRMDRAEALVAKSSKAMIKAFSDPLILIEPQQPDSVLVMIELSNTS